MMSRFFGSSEKRGSWRSLPEIKVMPKFIKQLTQRAVLETELFGHLLLRPVLNDHRPRRFVPPMINLSGMSEEPKNNRRIAVSSMTGPRKKNVNRSLRHFAQVILTANVNHPRPAQRKISVKQLFNHHPRAIQSGYRPPTARHLRHDPRGGC